MLKWEMRVVREVIVGNRKVLVKSLEEQERVEGLLSEAGFFTITRDDVSDELGTGYSVWVGVDK